MGPAQGGREMMLEYLGMLPRVEAGAFVAESANLIGDVAVGKDSSIWFNAVVRGDVNSIRIGERTNVQDIAVIHVTHNKWPTFIASNVTVGHGAIVHGCVIEEACLIGMGAILLDGCRIGENSIIAAGSVVREGMVVPKGSLVAGVPARIVRSLSDEEIRRITDSAQHYVEYISNYRKNKST